SATPLRCARNAGRVAVVAHTPGMPWWRQPDCPVRPVEQEWIERSMDWFVSQFGTARLRSEIILPTDDYFPGAYGGTRNDVSAVLVRLCAHMEIDPARVVLEFDEADDNPELSAHVPIDSSRKGAAGHHRVRGGRSIIGIRDDMAANPMALVATLAHEL